MGELQRIGSVNNLLRLPENVFKSLGGLEDPDSLVWSCDTCGEIQPRHYVNGYVRGKCACQIKERERLAEEKLRQEVRENKLARRRANCAKCYTWLNERLDMLNEMTFDNYNRDLFPVAYDRLQEFANCAIDEKGDAIIGHRSFLLYGSYGTGKTHLMSAVLNTLIEKLVVCRFMTGQGLFDAISTAIGNHRDYQHLIDEASSVPVLGIDDIDKVHISRFADAEENFQVKTFFNILNKRYVNKLTTLITTNALDITPYVGGAAFSRLKQHCVPLEMQGEDYRDTMIEWQ